MERRLADAIEAADVPAAAVVAGILARLRALPPQCQALDPRDFCRVRGRVCTSETPVGWLPGARVTVLEAAARAGGRTLSARAGGTTVAFLPWEGFDREELVSSLRVEHLAAYL